MSVTGLPSPHLAPPGASAVGGMAGQSASSSLPTAESLELAGRSVEKMLHMDAQYPPLVDKLRIGGHPSLSGLQEPDYPALGHGAASASALGVPAAANAPEAASLKQMSTVQRVPLPAELVEHFGHMQCNCMMGIFPQIGRAWLTIDSDLYVWRFEDCSDLAYFDGLGDTILSVGLITPKRDIFQPHIRYLLCLTTAVEMVLLGVAFSKMEGGDACAEMHLLPEPLFSLPTDSTYMVTVAGSDATGRVFLGGRDGCLYEFAYRADDGFFSKRAQKVNHSKSALSFLVPGFVSAALYEEDSIEQIVVDDSRHVLYTRSEKGVIQVFDLGVDGAGLNRVAAINQNNIVHDALRIASNIDKSNFAPLVSIACIPSSESIPLSLLAVSENGVRFYFSTASGSSPLERPHGITLQHVRLPPGFSASSVVPKPSKVHKALYRQGTLLLSSAQSEESDLLWLLSADAFPFQPLLQEGQSTLQLHGRAWAVDEEPQDRTVMRLYKESFSNQQPPLAVIQHVQKPRKFILLNANGTHIVSKLRPADHLRRLLIDHGGPDSDVVRAFFSLHSELQASATALVLATSQAPQDAQVSEWAARALFLYGGEPQLLFPQQAMRPPPPPGQPAIHTPGGPHGSFHPHLASTPAPHVQFAPGVGPQQGQQPPMMPEVHFSHRHNGLYLYFSRLIRPVWLATLVTPTSQDSALHSNVSSDEADWIMMQLNDFRAFMEKSALYSASSVDIGGAALAGNPQHRSQQEALLRERQSLLFLQHLVSHCLQVMGLWKVVCDHQFHLVVAALPVEDQNMLRGMYFRDLMISAPGRKLCNKLVQTVVELYLKDNASTDAISNRLREICPSLYASEDAISSKAHEMLIAARTSAAGSGDRERLIREAVAMCRGIAGRINLDVLLSHLTAVHHYEGVVEMALAAAAMRDPQGHGLHYYKNGEPLEDQQGLQAFLTRMSCYKHVMEVLQCLLDTSSSHPMAPSLPRGAGPPPPPDPNALPPGQAGEFAETVMRAGLASDDQLFHVALYQWLVDKGQFERLLSVRGPFLEDFLTRGTKKYPESIVMFDLLWKFYEKTKSYPSAARILSKLADRHSTEVNLQQRLEYLARAIMCVKSGEVGSTGQRGPGGGVGELLHDLEEKMEVARVQLLIVEALQARKDGGGADVQEALCRLNAELLDISQLYQDFAEPFRLWECQLAILHCSGHHDPPLVESMWENILDGEINKAAALQAPSKVALLTSKIKELAKLYSSSQKYFPLEFIIRKLELFSCQIRADHGWVYQAFHSVGVPLPKLLDTYNRLYLANESCWLTHGAPNHLLYVLSQLLSSFASNPTSVPYGERRQFTVVCLDAVGQYLSGLYTKHDAALLINQFRQTQAKLERM